VRNWGTSVTVGGASVFVGVSEIAALDQVRGKVELNPSRVVDPEGWGLSDAGELLEVLGEVVPKVREYVEPSACASDWAVRRVDVARDFEGVSEPGNKVRALAPVPRPWARRNLVHSDPARHGAQTLMVGSGAGVVRLYDKHAETGGRAPDGSLRWEAECRKDWAAEYGGLRVVADITEAGCRRLAENRWQWSGMGLEVGAMSAVVRAVATSGLSRLDQNGLIAFLFRQSEGDWAFMSSRSMVKYRRLQRLLGLSVVPGELSGSELSRLDWETGREVRRAA
jgi:hypothetical protein